LLAVNGFFYKGILKRELPPEWLLIISDSKSFFPSVFFKKGFYITVFSYTGGVELITSVGFTTRGWLSYFFNS
jgi:hypothetical protein